MSSIYYRCSICHKKVNESKGCRDCGNIGRYYSCKHTYWYERVWMTIKDFVRRITI